jgi:hypothetical protein
MRTSDGSSIKKRKSLVGFDDASIQSFLAARVDNVSMQVSFKNLDSGFVSGNALVGFHDYSTKPTTWSDARVDQNQFTVELYDVGRYGFTAYLDAYMDDFASGANAGLSFGPAVSTSTNYIIDVKGNVAGVDDPGEPWIEFIVTKWVAT